MQHETSKTHADKLASGLTVTWARSTGEADTDFSVVCYSDGIRWLFDNASAVRLARLGEAPDGLGRAEILRGDSGAIVALYADGARAFADAEAWYNSLPLSDRYDAARLT